MTEELDTAVIEELEELKRPIEGDNKIKPITNGGHSYSGSSTAERGTISLDLIKFNSVALEYDQAKKPTFVTVEGGCRWGQVYKTLVNGKYDACMINGGRCPPVGCSGFMLGGGLGPFTRSFGIGCDTITEAEIVNANGELVKVSERDDPDSKEGKLFWALRGAGPGNFGVLVKMKLQIQKLEGEIVVAGRITWYPTEGKKVASESGEVFEIDALMTTMEDFYTADWPDAMTIDTS
ncbi:hypothetical protein AA313_de0205156 [Arthrobotrys entomopaga]|nr:hypothetical protein AA313_de0205156 [Arthrobotrys entomopaga]